MGGDLQQLSKADAASLVAWWLDAGVDIAVAEEPRDWLRAPRPAAIRAPVAEDSLPDPVPPANPMPDSFEALEQWLGAEPGLPLDRPGAARVSPHGPAEAQAMLISEMPDRDDAADGRPIGGDAWKLAERMLEAAGIAPAQCRSASLACFFLPAVKPKGADLDRCSEIMRHHIAVAKPKRLLLLGDVPARVLLGQPLAAARGKVHRVNGVPTVATFHPRFLMQRPADKAQAWRDLLLLTGPEAE